MKPANTNHDRHRTLPETSKDAHYSVTPALTCGPLARTDYARYIVEITEQDAGSDLGL
jgi:hypothetical protein